MFENEMRDYQGEVGYQRIMFAVVQVISDFGSERHTFEICTPRNASIFQKINDGRDITTPLTLGLRDGKLKTHRHVPRNINRTIDVQAEIISADRCNAIWLT
jgi:hypothetical protein